TLASLDAIAGFQMAHDSPGNQAGDLAHDDRSGHIDGLDHDAVGFIAYAAFGMAGVEELTRPMGRCSDSTGARHPVDVDVKDGQEDSHAQGWAGHPVV